MMKRNGIELSNPVIEVDDLCKQVALADGQGDLRILQDIRFAVGAGESVAIVGASGSGKSTLLGLLAGLDVPAHGTVRVQGRDLFALDEDARAALRGEAIGFVFQSFQLLPALTALENVMLPLELAGVDDARAIATQWLQRVGLGSRLTHYPKHLSGGEQQRVALARAFAPDPRVLLADEPTGNLDAETGRAIIELMFALNREQGTTLILVTHDESLARRCGRVLRMDAGRLERRATPVARSGGGAPNRDLRRRDRAAAVAMTRRWRRGGRNRDLRRSYENGGRVRLQLSPPGPNRSRMPSRPVWSRQQWATSRSTGLAWKATPKPAARSMGMSLAPSPAAITCSGLRPNSSRACSRCAALASPSTMSPSTFPVSFPSYTSSWFAHA
jgi:putative ABC transport system ATP-binding protein